jgi:transcriptional regulator with XRE-family HTH domain
LRLDVRHLLLSLKVLNGLDWSFKGGTSLRMGRLSKNPENPITRLRAALSTPIRQMTRADLAKKAGIPEPSLKDIETGKYKLTDDVAMRIAFATGVAPRSLLNGADPLLDFQGQPFSIKSSKMDYLAELPLFQGAQRHLCEAAWETALQKRIGLLVSFSFDRWLISTIETFGLEKAFAENLNKRLGLFDPKEIASEFRPRNRQMAQEWKSFEEEITKEQNVLKEGSPEAKNAAEAFTIATVSREMAFEEVAQRKRQKREAKPARKQLRSPTRQAA